MMFRWLSDIVSDWQRSRVAMAQAQQEAMRTRSRFAMEQMAASYENNSDEQFLRNVKAAVQMRDMNVPEMVKLFRMAEECIKLRAEKYRLTKTQ